LAAFTVEAHSVTGLLNGTQHVPPVVWSAAGGGEHQRVPVHEPQVLLGLPGAVRPQLTCQRRQ
jgi:hypothetical protein